MCAKQIEPTGLLMPKASAVWLVENTALTFEQIADFTGLHPIEVQALADEEVGRGIVGRNPVEHHEVTQDELDKANANPVYMMHRSKTDLPTVKVRAKGPKYTPVSKRSDKPDGIAYILKHHPEITDAQICKLIGTTKPTIQSVRDRTHPSSATLKARHPVDLGLCTYTELDAASSKGFRAQGKDPEEIKRQKQQALEEQHREQSESNERENKFAGFDFTNFLSGGNKSSGN